jgi:hypothetical protein
MAHQDTYYLDSEHLGAMTAAWIAVEDIKPGAGRFYVYPKSHLYDIAKNRGEFDLGFNHARYKDHVKHVIEEQGFECRAPALSKGDVLFWNGKTIHGSLDTSDPQYSRRSFTAHYIPESHRFLQFQSKTTALKLRSINGMNVHHPKDLGSFSNRAILAIETTPENTIKRVVAAILSTQRDAQFTSDEEKAVRAADLAGLASDYKYFRSDVEKLRQEDEMLTGRKVAWDEWKTSVEDTIRLYLSQEIRFARPDALFYEQASQNLSRLLSEDARF